MNVFCIVILIKVLYVWDVLKINIIHNYFELLY